LKETKHDTDIVPIKETERDTRSRREKWKEGKQREIERNKNRERNKERDKN
jgi:hypothetical protein